MSRVFWVLLAVTLLLLAPIFTAVPAGIKFTLWLVASLLLVMELLWLTAVITRARAPARVQRSPRR